MIKNIIIVALCAVIFFSWSTIIDGQIPEPEPPIPETPKPTLTHQQMVWSYALEWCESRGAKNAINPEDRDGTPSFGGYQFKPSTLLYYAEMYGVATTTDVMDYKTQRAVVEQMILHRDEIRWETQFPDCVKKYGRPPAP